jgi:hypothetical protein
MDPQFFFERFTPHASIQSCSAIRASMERNDVTSIPAQEGKDLITFP